MCRERVGHFGGRGWQRVLAGGFGESRTRGTVPEPRVQLDYRVEFDIWSSGRQVQPPPRQMPSEMLSVKPCEAIRSPQALHGPVGRPLGPVT